MLLVGGQRLFDEGCEAHERTGSLSNLFQRLTREVRNTGEVTRYLDFQGRVEGTGDFEFFGIEVDKVSELPPGMNAWQLESSNLRIEASAGGGVQSAEQIELRWDWWKSTSTGPRPWVGEFSVPHPPPGLPNRLFLSANAYVGLHEEDSASDSILLSEYDPAWAVEFERFSSWLKAALGADVALRIEHYGSTAIPGIPSKPIIDVLVDIPSFDQAKRRVLPLLNDPQWEYWWYEDHFTFIRRNRLMGERTHHLHMAPRGHRLWDGILFRDYLRSHPAEAAAYARLKQDLASTYREDRERYTREKGDFVRAINRMAIKNGGT